MGLFGDAGSIITAGLAVYAVSVYEVRSFRRRRRLEDYLRQEKAKGVDKGQRSLLHLAAQLGISEQELVNISFSSKKIARRVRENPATGLAETLLLEYVADTQPHSIEDVGLHAVTDRWQQEKREAARDAAGHAPVLHFLSVNPVRSRSPGARQPQNGRRYK